jgi:hypothetical protein
VDLEQISRKIKAYPHVRITEKELREYVSAQDYGDYYKIMIELVESNVITPVKSSGSNGMRPPLYKRYNIMKPAVKYDELIPEIRLLNEKLNIEGYLNEPEKYKNHRDWILPIDNFLKNEAAKLEIPCSINERSFQLFQKEKALRENRELAVVLNFNPGLKNALNFYDTPEPFHAFYTSRIDVGLTNRILNILIIENKDTWYTLRNRMKPGFCSIAGLSFQCILYGEGRKIARIKDSLTDFDHCYFKDAKTCYYYFGDLDYEGIDIVHDLINANPLLQINLMLPLYHSMLDASEGIPLPMAKENQKNKAGEWFLSYFNLERQNKIKSILESGRYIPQEILNNSDFMKLICRDSQDEETRHV